MPPARAGERWGASSKIECRPQELPLSQTATAKQEVQQLLDHLPDTSTFEDIQYHLYVLEKIKRGRADIANGRSYTAEEARARLSRWLQR
jgi:predicted transcriptional regulator